MRNIVQVLLLGVLLLIGAGIVIPWVMRARETDKRARCTFNLMQLGVALRRYQDNNRSLPPGTMPNEALPPEERLSFNVAVLPVIDKGQFSSCYQEIDLKKGWNAAENAPAIRTRIPTFLCPSNYRGTPPDTPAPTHYIGMTGLGVNAARLPQNDPNAGLFGYDRQATLGKTKGLAYTIMMIETESEIGPWAAGGPPTVRGLDPNRRPYLGPGRQFGGNHLGGAFALYADLSVQFVNETINPKTFEGMCTISGGERVSEEF